MQKKIIFFFKEGDVLETEIIERAGRWIVMGIYLSESSICCHVADTGARAIVVCWEDDSRQGFILCRDLFPVRPQSFLVILKTSLRKNSFNLKIYLTFALLVS